MEMMKEKQNNTLQNVFTVCCKSLADLPVVTGIFVTPVDVVCSNFSFMYLNLTTKNEDTGTCRKARKTKVVQVKSHMSINLM